MIKAFVYILIGYLPFQIALNPYPDIDLMSGRVFILALFFCWLWTVRRSFGSEIKRVLNFQSVFLLVILVLATVSLSQAKEVFWGIRKILLLSSIFPLYFLITGILDNPEKINSPGDSEGADSPREKQIYGRVKKTIKILVFSAFPISLLGIFQFFSQFVFLPGQVTNFLTKWIAPIFYGRAFGWLVSANQSWMFEIKGKFYLRAISLFPDPHTFAFYLGLIIPLALSLLIFKNENRKLLLAICSSLFVALLLTFSRGGYLAMLSTLIIMSIVLGIQSNKLLDNRAKLIILLSLLALAAIVFLPFSPISQCFYSSFDFSRYSNIERIKVWKEALDSVALHPWFGVGIGNFPKVVDPWAKYLSPINAHSTYLDIVSEMGIFALWAWLILFIGTIFSLIHPYTKREQGALCAKINGVSSRSGVGVKQKNLLSFGLAGSLIWFSCHALVETPIYNPTILAILMVVLGLSTLINSIKKEW